MLRDLFKLAKDTVSKSPIISKVCLEKIFEFFLCYQIFGLKATFLLVLLLNHCLAKKRSYKRDLILSINLGGFEIVLILLAKTIII